MTQFKFLQTFIFGFSMAVLFFACNSGKETKPEKDTGKDEARIAETIDTSMLETSMPAKLPNILVIKHKVANFNKWKQEYESGDSFRRDNGLSNYIIGRGADDPSMVLVFLKMSDVDKAKELAGEMRDRMQKGTITGSVEFDYLDVVMNDTTEINKNARLMVKHKVRDWDIWKKEFDSHKQARMDAGLTDRGLGYSIDDKQMVTIVFAVADRKKADAFLNSQDLKNKMDSAGVIGPPSSFYYNIVQK